MSQGALRSVFGACADGAGRSFFRIAPAFPSFHPAANLPACCKTGSSFVTIVAAQSRARFLKRLCEPFMHKPEREDIRSQPAYPLAEAARYLKVAPATLRSWTVGRRYPTSEGVGRFRPLIHPPRRRPPMLSFWNLIEAHVLRAMRVDHGVSMDAMRKSLAYAQRTLGIDRLLLSKELCTEGGRVLLDHYGELIDLSASGQIAMRRVFEEHLARVEWDEWKFPVRLYPFPSKDNAGPHRPIAIDPQIAFGRPILARKSISTSIIAERIDAGEAVDELAKDYDLTVSEIEEAVLYERAA
ncbi:MAG TPA: DUF433 domain-containing protein [Steroidobacteraceae bacterium]|nr:DUF433 domain-containing protein [Steroidobacteraceae bacterium]